MTPTNPITEISNNHHNENTYFAALTGIRAIAAYMVYVHHYNFFSQETCGKTVHDFVAELHIGVTLFFVLSGFLIGFRYIDYKNFGFSNYMVNRIARIYPMYFLLTTLSFLFFAITQQNNDWHSLKLYIANITFIRGFSDSLKFSGIAQGWSLTVEESFYFLAPLFFVLIRKNIAMLFVLPLLLIGLGWFYVFILHDMNFWGFTFFENLEFMFNYTFWGRCIEFFIGIGLALFFKQKSQKSQLNKQTNYNYLTYVGVAVIILSVYSLSLLKGEADFGIRHPLGKLINTFLMPLFGIAVLYYGLLTEKTWLSKLLSSKLFVLLGKSSYIFYLIHMGVFAYFISEFTASNLFSYINNGVAKILFIGDLQMPILKMVLKTLTMFVWLNLLSILMFTYIEEPLNHLIRKKFRK